VNHYLSAALAEKLQAVAPMSSGQVVRPVTLVANLTGQSPQVSLPTTASPQQLAAAAQAGQQAAHQLMSALAAQQNTAVSVAVSSPGYSQVGRHSAVNSMHTVRYIYDDV